jgi:ankyrin repeat protein
MAALAGTKHTAADSEISRGQIGQRMRYRMKNRAATPAQQSHHRDGRPPHDGARGHVPVEVVGYDETSGRSVIKRIDGGQPGTFRTRLSTQERRNAEAERAAAHHGTRRHDKEFVRYGPDGKVQRAVDAMTEGGRTRTWGGGGGSTRLPLDYATQVRSRRDIVGHFNELEVAEGSRKMHYPKLSAKEEQAMQRRRSDKFGDIWEVHASLPTEPPGSRDPPRDEEEALARALYIAAVGGNAEAIRALLAKAERLGDAAGHQQPPPHKSKARSRLSAGQELVRRLVNSRDQGNDTPLHAAVCSGSNAAVKELLAHGADKHLRNDNEMTPIALATKAGNLAAVGSIQLATQSGTNPDIVHTLISDEELGLLLYKAAEHGNLLEVKGLLERGVFVDSTPHQMGTGNKSEWTPLHAAAHAGHEHIVDVLVEAGADFQRKTRDGKTALQLSAGRRTDFGVEMNRSAGAEVHLNCAKRLLRAAEEALPVVNRKLRDACHDGDAMAAAAALKLGADVNVVLDASSGMTPLHWAVKRDNFEVVEVLMAHVDAHDDPHPADIRARDARGLTPLDYVQQAAAPEAFVLSGHDGEQDPHVTFMGTYQVVSGGRMHNGSPVYRKQGAFVTVRVKSFVGGGAEQTVTKKLNGTTVYYAYRAKSGKWIITDEESSMHVDRGTLVSSVALNLPTDAITAAERSGVVFEERLRGGRLRPTVPAVTIAEADAAAMRGEQDRPRGLGMVAENKIQKRFGKRAAIKALLEDADQKLSRLEAMKVGAGVGAAGAGAGGGV